MNDYSKKLRAIGLTDLQITTILSGWSCDSIEALLRGEKNSSVRRRNRGSNYVVLRTISVFDAIACGG